VEAVEWIVLVVVLLLVLAVAATLMMKKTRKRRSEQLQSEFGPEYDRTVEATGKRSAAERELAERRERRHQLDIRPLPAGERQAFAARWGAAQERFVDSPGLAVREADHLVAEVMGRRGYPVEDFEQRARDVSVDHPEVVQEYRAAHDISELNDREQASTEQLRQAMVHYRALFTELLEETDDRRETVGPGHTGERERERVEVERRDDERPGDERLERERVVSDRHDLDRDDVDQKRAALDRDGVDRERSTGDGAGSVTEDHPPATRQRVVVERLGGTGIDVSRGDGERVEPGGLRADPPSEDAPPRH
jgi:hypothetical protein